MSHTKHKILTHQGFFVSVLLHATSLDCEFGELRDDVLHCLGDGLHLFLCEASAQRLAAWTVGTERQWFQRRQGRRGARQAALRTTLTPKNDR